MPLCCAKIRQLPFLGAILSVEYGILSANALAEAASALSLGWHASCFDISKVT